MPSDTHDKLYTIALDLQKQMGVLGSETAKQSEMLKSIEQQVIKTNGRVTKLETINITNDKEKEFTRGRLTIIGSIAGAVGSIVMAIIIKLVTRYF